MSRPPLSLQAPLLRFVATSLVFGTAVLGLAACGDDDDGDTADGSTSKATATATSVKGNVAAQSALVDAPVQPAAFAFAAVPALGACVFAFAARRHPAALHPAALLGVLAAGLLARAAVPLSLIHI